MRIPATVAGGAAATGIAAILVAASAWRERPEAILTGKCESDVPGLEHCEELLPPVIPSAGASGINPR